MNVKCSDGTDVKNILTIIFRAHFINIHIHVSHYQPTQPHYLPLSVSFFFFFTNIQILAAGCLFLLSVTKQNPQRTIQLLFIPTQSKITMLRLFSVQGTHTYTYNNIPSSQGTAMSYDGEKRAEKTEANKGVTFMFVMMGGQREGLHCWFLHCCDL